MPSIAWVRNTIPNLIHEDFEIGVNTPPRGWLNDDATASTWNFTPALLGSFSARANADGSSGGLRYELDTTFNEVFVFFYFKILSLTLTTSIFNVFNLDGGAFPGNQMLRLNVNATTGTVEISCKGGIGAQTTVSAMAANTLYYVWVHFQFVTAGTSVASVGFSTTESRPTAGNNFASLSNGTANFAAKRLTWGPGGGGASGCVYDHIGVSTVDTMDTGWGGF